MAVTAPAQPPWRCCSSSSPSPCCSLSAGCGGSRRGTMLRRLSLRWLALVYLLVILLGPLAMVFWRAFEHGFGTAWDAITEPNTLHAFQVTLIVAAIAVPFN